MIRFICAVFKIPYENCKGCEILKQQLEIANEENRMYLNTILDIVKPKVVEPVANEVQKVPTGPMLMSRRKAILAEQDRIRARVENNSPHIARSDNEIIKNAEANRNIIPATEESIKKLEEELGLEGEGA